MAAPCQLSCDRRYAALNAVGPFIPLVDSMASHPASASCQHGEAFTLGEECGLISYLMPHKQSENGPDLRPGASGGLGGRPASLLNLLYKKTQH